LTTAGAVGGAAVANRAGRLAKDLTLKPQRGADKIVMPAAKIRRLRKLLLAKGTTTGAARLKLLELMRRMPRTGKAALITVPVGLALGRVLDKHLKGEA
jgi:hypothetical protein